MALAHFMLVIINVRSFYVMNRCFVVNLCYGAYLCYGILYLMLETIFSDYFMFCICSAKQGGRVWAVFCII